MIDLRENTPGCVSAHLLHLGQDVLLKIAPLPEGIQIILELGVGDLIGGLISAVFGIVFLDGIVGEVYFWVEAVDVEAVS